MCPRGSEEPFLFTRIQPPIALELAGQLDAGCRPASKRRGGHILVVDRPRIERPQAFKAAICRNCSASMSWPRVPLFVRHVLCTAVALLVHECLKVGAGHSVDRNAPQAHFSERQL